MINDDNRTQSIQNMRARTIKLEREGDYWTDDEREQLARMFYEGKGITAMALCLQRTEPAVVQQIEKLDLYCRKACPVRSKPVAKPSPCLCNVCQHDRSSCPRCCASEATEEAE